MFLSTLEKNQGNPAQAKAIDLGFPTRKNEAFSYLDLKKLEERSFASQTSGTLEIDNEKVEALSLDEALDKYGLYVSNSLKKLERDESFFSLINSGWGQEVKCLFINESIEDLVSVIEEYKGNDTMFLPKVIVFAKPGVKASLHWQVNLKGSSSLVSRVIEVVVEKGAELSFFETSDIEHDNDVFFHTKVNLKHGSTFNHRSGTLGCKSFRNEIKAYLLEEEATCNLEGFWNGGVDESIHHLVHCSHLAENTNSRQHYQGACEEKARASFEGQIYVDKVAQKTDSYQLSKHLLIGEKARGFSKPNLEVFADDVKASHGATISRLSEEELFYLQSRGISEKAAGSLLKQGFLSFFINDIEEEKVQKAFSGLI